jgi:hypothetical protein
MLMSFPWVVWLKLLPRGPEYDLVHVHVIGWLIAKATARADKLEN